MTVINTFFPESLHVPSELYFLRVNQALIKLSPSPKHTGLCSTGGHKRPLSVYRNTTSDMESMPASLTSLAKLVCGGSVGLHLLLEGQGRGCNIFSPDWVWDARELFEVNMSAWLYFTLGVLLIVA